MAQSYSLQWQARPEYWIPATHSHDQALDLVLASARQAGLDLVELDQPQRWSDDFGVLTQHYPGAYFGLGAGDDCGHLHGPDYDFPDAILGPALHVLWGIITRLNTPGRG